MGGVGSEELHVCVVLRPGSEEFVEAIPPSVQLLTGSSVWLSARGCHAVLLLAGSWVGMPLLSPALLCCFAGFCVPGGVPIQQARLINSLIFLERLHS